MRETSSLCSDSMLAASPAPTAASRRLKCVFTELLKRRFSSRSRSVRLILFFCEAILAMERPAERAANENRAMNERGDWTEGEPPAPPEPFDPSTTEFPAVRPEEDPDPGRPFSPSEEPPGTPFEPPASDARAREAER